MSGAGVPQGSLGVGFPRGSLIIGFPKVLEYSFPEGSLSFGIPDIFGLPGVFGRWAPSCLCPTPAVFPELPALGFGSVEFPEGF